VASPVMLRTVPARQFLSTWSLSCLQNPKHTRFYSSLNFAAPSFSHHQMLSTAHLRWSGSFYSMQSAFLRSAQHTPSQIRQMTYNQVLRGARKTPERYCRTLQLRGAPQKRGKFLLRYSIRSSSGTCVRVYVTKPKKPNSAQRKVAKVKLTNGLEVVAAVPGVGHNLQQHSVVLVRGGRVRDLPGCRFKLIRGKYDFNFKENFERQNRRSKYSTPKPRKDESGKAATPAAAAKKK